MRNTDTTGSTGPAAPPSTPAEERPKDGFPWPRDPADTKRRIGEALDEEGRFGPGSIQIDP